MTDEKFEKAREIKTNIETIGELQSLLANSKNNGFGDKYLAAIESNDCICGGNKILNRIQVPAFIMEKFENILWDECRRLEKEFEEL